MQPELQDILFPLKDNCDIEDQSELVLVIQKLEKRYGLLKNEYKCAKTDSDIQFVDQCEQIDILVDDKQLEQIEDSFNIEEEDYQDIYGGLSMQKIDVNYFLI